MLGEYPRSSARNDCHSSYFSSRARETHDIVKSLEIICSCTTASRDAILPPACNARRSKDAAPNREPHRLQARIAYPAPTCGVEFAARNRPAHGFEGTPCRQNRVGCSVEIPSSRRETGRRLGTCKPCPTGKVRFGRSSSAPHACLRPPKKRDCGKNFSLA